MSKAHPLSVTVGLAMAVVGGVLIGLSVVTEDFACVEEKTIDFEGLGQIIDQVDGLLLDQVLLSSVLEDRASLGGKQGCVNSGCLALRPDEDEQDVGL